MFHYPKGLCLEALLPHVVTKCQQKTAYFPYMRAMMVMHIALIYTQIEVK